MQTDFGTLQRLHSVYSDVLGTGPDVARTDLVDRLINADPDILVELDSALQEAGVHQFLQRMGAQVESASSRHRSQGMTSDDDTPLAFSSEQLEAGERYLASMLSAADSREAPLNEASEGGAVADVLDVSVYEQASGHAVVTLRIDVPSDGAERWKGVRRLDVFEHQAGDADGARGRQLD